MNANAVGPTTSGSERARLTRELPLVVVDASNVARGGLCGGRSGRLGPLLQVTSQIAETGCERMVVADASLRHHIDKKEEFEGLVRNGSVLQAPAGRSADQFIAHIVEKRRGEGQQVWILTNDLLRDYPTLGATRITYLAITDEEVVFDPPLGTLNPRREPPEVKTLQEVGVGSSAPVLEEGGHGWR